MRYCSVILLTGLLMILTGCGGSNTRNSAQVLTFPNVGITDIATLDPALGPDSNSLVAVNMIYSGLVRSDKSLNVQPDQAATWQISNNQTIYTFRLKRGITFSDGTPVTAQSYVYSWTRALLPEVASGVAAFFEAAIVGAGDVATGKTKVLRGVKALDDSTLQVTLLHPTPYFLQELTNAFFFPLNRRVIERYGQKDWPQRAAGSGIGTGPFMVKEWDHNVKMVFVPNPTYYGNKTKLAEVDMIFVSDHATAFKSYQANQYDFVWNLTAQDQLTAKSLPGFIRSPLLQTDLMFFDNTKPPFDNAAVRQAFAYAIDKATLVQAVLKDSVTPARTIIPPGMAGYQPDYSGIPFDSAKAMSLLQSVYPDVSKVPPITFSYASSQVTSQEAAVLQDMWQKSLGIHMTVHSVELTAYNDELSKHQIQFGFIQWTADFPDPYDWLTLNLYSTANNNNGEWHNPDFDRTVTLADMQSGDARIKLYNEAEQIAITDVGWLPIDYPAVEAVLAPWVHGVMLNGEGLYFGDWSDVYILPH